MTLIDAREIPADPASADRLSTDGLDYRVIDTTDAAESESFQRAVSRGFLGPEQTAEALAFGTPTFESRRNIGVFDGAAPDGRPVATVDSWVTPLTLPGGGELPMWAISGVTVSATHRRRGIARALLEGELRAAASAGVPMAGLTVSEATIYGRYGFGAAVPVARVAVDTRRAGWTAPVAPGRLEYIDRETLAAELGAVHERARGSRSGQIPGWTARWEQMSGLAPADTDRDRVRGVRYRDTAGEVRGAIAYTLAEGTGDAAWRHTLRVRLLVAETAEASAALWRFALQHDLVDRVEADLRPLDDALPWLVHDQRGVTQTVHDHGWLRILDVRSALTARRYSAPVDLVLRVTDPLGFTTGDWRLRVDATGAAEVEAVEGGTPDAELDVSALSSIYVGGVRAASLFGAGRIVAAPDTIAALDRAFVSLPAPVLDIWY
ncbi:GNAT family N-acetyltransferase [Microbacterium sp. NPDC089696]|uniref:GNAT family N-acetyltransferase n=1 Tax=Microbacterium sp. NPDC089696 TaxID=3364199 RepID=UPI00382EA370